MEPGEILFLNYSEVESLLTWKKVVETCDDVFRWIGEGKVEERHIVPMRYQVEGKRAFALPHPAYVKPLNALGNKWGGASFLNPEKGLPWGSAEITLNDPETVYPIAIMDGGRITSMRTGGHAAVGAKYLARKDSEVVAIMGCGVEGRSHLLAINEFFKLKEARAFDIHKTKAKEYAEEMGKQLNINIKICNSPKEAAEGADIICMVTTSTEPVVLDEMIKPGCHVAATFAFADLDPRFSKTADKWVLGSWARDSEWIESPFFPGGPRLSKKDVYADLGEIAAGKKPGREKKTERTVMSHLGIGALDVAVAHHVYQMALEKGIGKKLRLF